MTKEIREAKSEESKGSGEQPQSLKQLTSGQERMLMIRLLHCLEDYDKVTESKLRWCLSKNVAYRYLEKAIILRDNLKYSVLSSKFDWKCIKEGHVNEDDVTDIILGCLLKGIFKQVAVKIGEDKYVLSTDQVAVDPVGLTSVVPIKNFVVYSELYQDVEGIEVNLIQPVNSDLLEGLPIFYHNMDNTLRGSMDDRDYFRSVIISQHLLVKDFN